MEKHSDARVTLSIEAQKTLITDIYERKHIEACGVLLGTIDEQENWRVTHVIPLRNIFESRVYFEFAPEDLLAVDLDYPGQVIGAYHSHPTGLARASSTDRNNMKRVNQEEQIPWVWLIASGPFDTLSSWQEQLAATPLVAYHHYANKGLQRVLIQLEDI